MVEESELESRYQEMMAGLQLISVIMQSGSFERNVDAGPGKADVNVEKSVEFSVEQDRKRFRFLDNLTLTMKLSESDTQITKIICGLQLTYSSPIEVDEDLVEAFAERNLNLHSWPYQREFVQNATSRMEIPQIRLPLLLSATKE